MRKAIFSILASVFIILIVVLNVFMSGPAFRGDGLEFILLLVVAAFGLYSGIRRIQSVRNGQPAEDELSRKVKQRASSLSYFISIYYWIFIMVISKHTGQSPGQTLEFGIIGMAAIFVFVWAWFNFRGIRE